MLQNASVTVFTNFESLRETNRRNEIPPPPLFPPRLGIRVKTYLKLSVAGLFKNDKICFLFHVLIALCRGSFGHVVKQFDKKV